MFYAHYVLSKKGPLARIWLAAHWDKKLTRNHVFDTNITNSVEAILQPQVKLALRTSGHLLLGVVRIYSRQAKYLLADCNEAFVKIKMAFRPGMESTGSHNVAGHNDDVLAAITLQENIRDFESTLADLNDIGDTQHVAMNQSRVEDITMREEFGEVNLGRPDDDFGDSNFVVEAHDDSGDKMGHLSGVEGGRIIDNNGAPGSIAASLVDHNNDDNNDDDDVVGGLVVNDDFVGGRNFTDMPPSVSILNNQSNDDDFGDANDGDDDYDSDDNLGVMSPGHNMETDSHTPLNDDTMFQNTRTSSMLGPGQVGTPLNISSSYDNTIVDSGLLDSTTNMDNHHDNTVTGNLSLVLEEEGDVRENTVSDPLKTPPVSDTNRQTVNNKPNSAITDFILPPLRDLRQENRRGPKRKLRKLIIDEHKSIPSDVMKLQMQDTSEITTRLDLAPPTRKLMQWKETGTAEYLLSHPGRHIPSATLQRLFYRNMKTRPIPNNAPNGLPILKNDKVIESQENEEPQNDFQNNDNEDDMDVDYPMNQMTGACSEYSAVFDTSFTPHPANHENNNIMGLNEDGGVPTTTDEDNNNNANTTVALSVIEEENKTTNAISMCDDSMAVSDLEKMRLSEGSMDNSHAILDDGVNGGSYGLPRPSMDLSLMSSTTVSGPVAEDADGIANNNLIANHDDKNTMMLQSAIQTLDNRMDSFDRELKEQQEELTIEGLEKRSEIMSSVLKTAFDSGKELVFQDLTVSNNKKQAASKFYTLLLLGKSKVVRLKQETPFSNIIISPYTLNESVCGLDDSPSIEESGPV